MNVCDGPIATILNAATSNYGWSCFPLPESDAALISTGRRYSDSEPVELFVRPADTKSVVISDGGETLNRLTEAGLDLDDEVHHTIWNEALYDNRLETVDGKVFVHVSNDRAHHVLPRFADALVGLDTLRLFALPPNTRATLLADEVENFLESRFANQFTRAPVVKMKHGLTMHPTFRVNTTSHPIYMQVAASTTKTRAYEHAFTQFSLAERGNIPIEQRLVVLGGSAITWTLPKLEVLANVAYVGFWKDKPTLDGFLRGDIPNQRLMVPSHNPNTMLPA